MIPAARTNATPDARLPQSRSGSDGTPHDDGFDSAMADVAQNGSDAASTKAVAAASAPVQPGAGQRIAALLAKLANGAPLASADGKGAAGSRVTQARAMPRRLQNRTRQATTLRPRLPP